ncbi:acylphosphatase-2 isoform X5 [Bubalus bubalis]|nr:acylphosphatase-2 isoform X5 [Bubalus bubalis]
MYTEDEARKIGVVGWVKNTSKGTVTGQVQGPEEKVNSMKNKTTKQKMSFYSSDCHLGVSTLHMPIPSSRSNTLELGEYDLLKQVISRLQEQKEGIQTAPGCLAKEQRERVWGSGRRGYMQLAAAILDSTARD